MMATPNKLDLDRVLDQLAEGMRSLGLQANQASTSTATGVSSSTEGDSSRDEFAMDVDDEDSEESEDDIIRLYEDSLYNYIVHVSPSLSASNADEQVIGFRLTAWKLRGGLITARLTLGSSTSLVNPISHRDLIIQCLRRLLELYRENLFLFIRAPADNDQLRDIDGQGLIADMCELFDQFEASFDVRNVAFVPFATEKSMQL